MESLHTVLPRALIELFKQGPLSQGKLEVAWRIAVGDALSRVSTVRLKADGAIDIHAVDARWRRELKRSSGVILRKLNALLGPGTVSTMDVK
jgi:Dna[CI] antecedent DciA-like protein